MLCCGVMGLGPVGQVDTNILDISGNQKLIQLMTISLSPSPSQLSSNGDYEIG